MEQNLSPSPLQPATRWAVWIVCCLILAEVLPPLTAFSIVERSVTLIDWKIHEQYHTSLGCYYEIIQGVKVIIRERQRVMPSLPEDGLIYNDGFVAAFDFRYGDRLFHQAMTYNGIIISGRMDDKLSSNYFQRNRWIAGKTGRFKSRITMCLSY